jgi:hypothetical protein
MLTGSRNPDLTAQRLCASQNIPEVILIELGLQVIEQYDGSLGLF